MLTAVWASAGLVLLLACANVAALIAARGAERTHEIAIRSALGAARARLVRQLLTETALLAVLGGAAGLMLGRWTLALLVAYAPPGLPRLSDIALDGRVLLVGAAATLLVALTVGLAPAFHGARREWATAFVKAASTGRSHRAGGGGALVAVQMSLAVVLSIGAGLLGRSLLYLVTIDHGFAADRLLAIDLYLRDGSHEDVAQVYRELIERAESVAGVRSAAIALNPPTVPAGFRMPVRVGGAPPDASAVLRPVTLRYFETAGVRLNEGRALAATDDAQAPKVAIVNDAFVRSVFRGRPAVGATLQTQLAGTLRVVGVAADVRPGGVADRPAVYVPNAQFPFVGGSLLVRTDGEPRAIVPALLPRLRAAAPALALDRIYDAAGVLAAGRAVTRFHAQVASGFAALALLLAAVGAYGLTAGEVAARWRDLAVRVALGAGRTHTLWTVIRPGASALATGVVAGVTAARALPTWMDTQLAGVNSGDPAVIGAVAGVLALVGVFAAVLAGARVLGLDPADVLRRD